jgi:protein-disulfide isomerase
MKAGRTVAGAGRRIECAAGATVAAIVAATVVLILAAIVTLAPRAAWAADASGNQVVATVGDHQITLGDLDAAVLQSVSKSQLYELRKQALDKMLDTELIDAAAKKANLTPDAYLARELHSNGGQVTEADARKYYDAHKAGIDAQTGGRPFSAIKGLLINAIQRHNDRDKRDALVAKLRTAAHVKVTLEAPRMNIVSSGHPWTGGKDAKVTIVEFSDFQCPYCRSAEPVLKQVRSKYGDKVKFVYMDFPLGMHQHAMDAAVAGRCAAAQDKFWQLHDAMFSDQTKLDAAGLKASAAKAGLDTKKFDACFDARPGVDGIKSDQVQGERLGVSGTPTFFVNGRELVGMESESAFSDVIDDELSRTAVPQAQANAH